MRVVHENREEEKNNTKTPTWVLIIAPTTIYLARPYAFKTACVYCTRLGKFVIFFNRVMSGWYKMFK